MGKHTPKLICYHLCMIQHRSSTHTNTGFKRKPREWEPDHPKTILKPPINPLSTSTSFMLFPPSQNLPTLASDLHHSSPLSLSLSLSLDFSWKFSVFPLWIVDFPQVAIPTSSSATQSSSPGHGVVNQLPLLKDLTLILGDLLTAGNDLDGLALLHATHVHFIVFPGDDRGWQGGWLVPILVELVEICGNHITSMVYGWYGSKTMKIHVYSGS